MLDHRRRRHDLAGLGLARHAIRGVHRRAEHVAILEHHRSEIAADADGDGVVVDPQQRMGGNMLLHHRRGIQGIVGRRKGGHHLIAHGLDDGAVVLFRASPSCSYSFVLPTTSANRMATSISLPIARTIILNQGTGALRV